MRDLLISVWTLCFFVCHSNQQLTLTSSSLTSVLRPILSGGRQSEDLREREIRRHKELAEVQTGDLTGISSFEPYFVNTERHVKAPFGGTAYLRCRILQLGDRVVSWVRQSDLQILTSSTFVYTSDHRFRAIHSPVTNDWTLEINDSSFNDSELQTKIPEGPVVLVEDGDDMKLNCLINFVPANWASSYVFWFHDKRLLNYDGSGRWAVTTEKVNNESSQHLLSRLEVRGTDQSDSGNYSCQLNAPGVDSAHSHPAHVQVLVLDGSEYLSAIQGLSSRDGSRLNPAKSWSASTALEMQQRLLFSMLAVQILIIKIGLR